MTRLILQPGPSGREQIAAWKGANRLGVEIAWTDYIEPGDVPVGDVPFCQSVMARQEIKCPNPDFYPAFLSEWMHRKWFPLHMPYGNKIGDTPLFLKSSEEFKDYPARVFMPGEDIPRCVNWASEVVKFSQEWRYYIADGKLVTTGWYDGYNENEPAPLLNIKWPKGFCGAVDFGRIETGKIALVESHPPFACGWYGDDPELFVLWLIEGWESLK